MLQPLECVPPDSFTAISFASASLSRSNIGGMGGRCDTNAALCTDGLRSESTPTDMLIKHIATLSQVDPSETIGLRITNETEYKAWNTNVNGVKRQRGSVNTADEGFFGAINLLAPRPPNSVLHWHADLTFVQLRFEFVRSSSSEMAVTIAHTFVTFYDFDGEHAMSTHAH